MSSPLLWIIFPGLLGLGMLFFLNYPRAVKWTGVGASCGLAGLGLVLPIGEPLPMLPGDWTVAADLTAAGRRLVLESGDRPLIILVFGMFALWSLMVDLRHVSIRIVPLGMMGAGLILTALAVEPIFYGALVLSFLALLYTLILTPPPNPASQAVLRFLIFQVLGTMLILFAAWMFSWIDLSAVEELLLVRAVVVLGVGFSLLLAVFPFSSWIFMLAEESHPFLTAFVLNTYLTAVLLFGVRFLASAPWLPGLLEIQGAIRGVGVVMILLGSISGFTSVHLGRTMGFTMAVEIGRSLLAVSLLQDGYIFLFRLIIVQTAALTLWALALTMLESVVKDLNYRSLPGSARQWPALFLGQSAGQFTLAGLPLLAGFPVTWSLAAVLRDVNPLAAGVLLVGSAVLLAGAVRSSVYLLSSAGEEDVLVLSTNFSRIVITTGVLASLLLGVYPRVLNGILAVLGDVFSP